MLTQLDTLDDSDEHAETLLHGDMFDEVDACSEGPADADILADAETEADADADAEEEGAGVGCSTYVDDGEAESDALCDVEALADTDALVEQLGLGDTDKDDDDDPEGDAEAETDASALTEADALELGECDQRDAELLRLGLALALEEDVKDADPDEHIVFDLLARLDADGLALDVGEGEPFTSERDARGDALVLDDLLSDTSGEAVGVMVGVLDVDVVPEACALEEDECDADGDGDAVEAAEGHADADGHGEGDLLAEEVPLKDGDALDDAL